MTGTGPLSPETALSAWMGEIAAHGWAGASIEGAAARAGATPEALLAAIGTAADALGAFADRVAREAALAAATGASVRDRLFGGFMAGFDALQAERAAVLRLLAARDPLLAVRAAGWGVAGLRRIAAVAGVDVTGPAGALRVAALGTVAARALNAWRSDESADLSRTMSELDRLLAEAETVAREGLSLRAFGISLPGTARD